MDFFKKIGKEVSVFGLVFVVFIALFAYRQATHVELSTISQDKLEEKIKTLAKTLPEEFTVQVSKAGTGKACLFR